MRITGPVTAYDKPVKHGRDHSPSTMKGSTAIVVLSMLFMCIGDAVEPLYIPVGASPRLRSANTPRHRERAVRLLAKMTQLCTMLEKVMHEEEYSKERRRNLEESYGQLPDHCRALLAKSSDK